jgi:hypothetical protein
MALRCLAWSDPNRLTGHARQETLAIYQHVALDGQLEERYQKAMREVEI